MKNINIKIMGNKIRFYILSSLIIRGGLAQGAINQVTSG